MGILKVGNDAVGTEFSNISTRAEAYFWGAPYVLTGIESGDKLIKLGIGEIRAEVIGDSVGVALYTDEGSGVFNLIHKYTFVPDSDSIYKRYTVDLDIDLTAYAGKNVVIAVGEYNGCRANQPADGTGTFRWTNSTDVLADPYGVTSGYITNTQSVSAWAEVQRGAVSEVTVTQATLTPGSTISGTYSGYVTIPTKLEGIRGTNSIGSDTGEITDLVINNTVNGDTNEGTFTATLPSLPGSGTAQFLRFSDSGASVADPTWRLS